MNTIATDNIFKFYALGGLSVFIACIIGINSTIQRGNEKIVEYSQIWHSNNNSDTEEKTLPQHAIEEYLEARKVDKPIFEWGFGIVAALSFITSCYGFRKWHKEIQPRDDRIKFLQIIQLEKELGIRSQLNNDYEEKHHRNEESQTETNTERIPSS